MTAAQPAAKALDFNDEQNRSKTVDNAPECNPPEKSKDTTPKKKLGLYIGKFPWWITEQDILRMAINVGVQDVVEVKFAENKMNGLSKGYVEVVVSSEGSMKLLLDKVPKCTLGGENIICRHASPDNLTLFEDLDKQNSSPHPASSNMNDSGCSFLPQNPFDSTVPEQFFSQFGTTDSSVPNPFVNSPPPLLHMPPPPMLPFMFLNTMKSPGIPNFNLNSVGEIAGTSQEWHSNSTSNSNEKTDKEFEELINRNRAVASTAISKAVSGATTGNLKSAMETLLTAISIIKQSRVYQDDRCQAMVTSLKDCLVSIQGDTVKTESEIEGNLQVKGTVKRESGTEGNLQAKKVDVHLEGREINLGALKEAAAALRNALEIGTDMAIETEIDIITKTALRTKKTLWIQR
ncbi:hypothetical protein WMY93_013507 [Mugilogobius chulae]|uniref:RRM domain-containing protein n=1 Tax=Mugilogobius chulae TaxID=88201 RepID=A0AAW0P051_9GOBI